MQLIRPTAICLLYLWLAPLAHAQRSDATPHLLLANVANARIDPSPYLLSEKYDGVRALWDGNALRSRMGNVIAAPAWFIDRLPPTPLDGELWMARGQFEKVSG